MAWVDVLSEAELATKSKAVVRVEGRQILLLKTERGIFACNNRCPHEGYPLSEGALSAGCILTCNWHNWKFDLESGATLIGGDALPRYPVRLESGRILLDIQPIDRDERHASILNGIRQALDDADEQRLVRETARLVRLDADPLDAVRTGIIWAADRLQYGTTHAIAGAPDWIRLAYDAAPDSAESLAALGEILGHLTEDARAARHYPFPEGEMEWDESSFLESIEREDEASAIAILRGALRIGRRPADLAPVLYRAALAHYADFGHALIYTAKTIELSERLGPSLDETLLALLVRSVVFATREDRLPEFRGYAKQLDGWGRLENPAPPMDPVALRRTTPASAMAASAAWGARYEPTDIFAVLVEEAAWILAHVDEKRLDATDARLADTVGWLDFTHALTFAEAGLRAVQSDPELWPALLLQLACFIGRNEAYADPASVAPEVTEIALFLAERRTALIDHGVGRFIISVHLTKTLLAVETLIRHLPDQAPILASALKRLLDAKMKLRHGLRTARQMRDLVAQE